MNKNIKWYRLEKILNVKAQYYIIIGERSNGKTYATLQYFLDRYFNHGELFGYIKTHAEHIKAKYMDEVFTHLEDYVIEKYNKKIKFYRGCFYCYDIESDGKLRDCELMGHAFALSTSGNYKGTSYPKVCNVVFEEFMSIDCSYLPDEINLLLNLTSTIARHRTNVRVFMLANTISKYNPYFAALGLKAHRMDKGKIITRKYSNKDGFTTTFAIERTENVNVYNNADNVNKVVYNIFGNSGVGNMITTGDFETHKYKTNIDGYTFNENKCVGDKIINKKYVTPFILRFEDYYYRIYFIDDHVKEILAFREVEYDSIKESNTSHIINGVLYIGNIVNVNDIMSYFERSYNDFFNMIVRVMKQKDFIIINDDDGENVVNGFRLSGLSYIHK